MTPEVIESLEVNLDTRPVEIVWRDPIELSPKRNLKRDAKRLRYFEQDGTTLEKRDVALRVADRILREVLADNGVYRYDDPLMMRPAHERVSIAMIVNASDRIQQKVDQYFAAISERVNTYQSGEQI